MAWSYQRGSPKSTSGAAMSRLGPYHSPARRHDYDSDGNCARVRPSSAHNLLPCFDPLKAQIAATRKPLPISPLAGELGSLHFTLGDGSAELAESSSIHTGSKRLPAHSLCMQTPGSSTVGLLGSSGAHPARADTNLPQSNHCRPSMAFSSNWSSSGSEGHESFFGRQKNSHEQETLQLRRLTRQSLEHASQPSPHSMRRPPAQHAA